MSSYRHTRLNDVYDDDEATDEDDLTLDELDPQVARYPHSSLHNGDHPGRVSGLGINFIQSRRSRSLQQTHHRVGSQGDGATAGLLEDDVNSGESSRSLYTTDDRVALLRADTDDRTGSRHRRSLLTEVWTRIKATPNSIIQEDCDTPGNRQIRVGSRQTLKYPPNIVSNAKYTPWSFLPLTLYHEFSFFLNLYFLLVALSQIIPPLRIGYWPTYIAPLIFVLCITLGKEAYDDITRRRRDAEANSELYTVLVANSTDGGRKRKKTRRDRLDAVEDEELHLGSGGGVMEVLKMSQDLRIGDILKLTKDRRVPADAVILKSLASAQDEDDGGEAFIRTDQLDGETDWKLRLAPPVSQAMDAAELYSLTLEAGAPVKTVNEFIGTMSWTAPDHNGHDSGQDEVPRERKAIPLNIDNTLWANTVLASNSTTYATVVYTGPQTRQAMSTSLPRTKTGLLEYELNSLTKILCLLTLLLSLLLVIIERIRARDDRTWYVATMRYLILFSTIVPISLRVNLDLGKSVYAWFIHRDPDIPGTIVRSSTIPEDLGRIEYLLSDKTGTLTQNDMQLKKIHVGTVSYSGDVMSEVSAYVDQSFSENLEGTGPQATVGRSRREIGSRVKDIVLALALCHNVTPTTAEEDGGAVTTYQASSPDEIAIVRWTEAVGLKLSYRDRTKIVLQSTKSGREVVVAHILHIFPFTSEGKRMGIILRLRMGEAKQEEQIWFYQKGADTVMASIVAANDWLDEESANMAREGLRTLVVGRRRLSLQQYEHFAIAFKQASLSFQSRDADVAKVIKEHLEYNVELLGITGVEDKLQKDVKPSLELLRNAGVKIWMLTGDKVETARCVAVSSKLVARGQYVHTVTKMKHKDQAQDSLGFLKSKPDACMLIDGESLALMLRYHRDEFIAVAVTLSAVVACRCSPLQKAEVALLIRQKTKKRVCCIGDGGNDVSMIQAADVGIGIVGKEGRQASLAADFSITQFCHLTKLLVWHGRNSYKRSAKLAQFVIHRGLIISVCQTVYSIAKGFQPDALFINWLLVGYATVYTMMPVFSLTLDTDIPPQLAHLYPELYAELSTSRSLSYRSFFVWVGISVYQGCIIQILALILTPSDAQTQMLLVSYSALILNELCMVAGSIIVWHVINVLTIGSTAIIYMASVPFLGDYFDLQWLATSPGPWWRIALVWACSFGPVVAVVLIWSSYLPPSYVKVRAL